MIHKYFKRWVFALVLSIGLILMQSCERINDHKENGIQLATDYCSMQSDFAAIVEVADQMGDQTTAKGTPIKFLLDAFGRQTVVRALDTTYFDGDGIEFEIDFGPTSLPLSENQRGYDGKYRAGKMHVKIETHYQEKLSKLEIEINKFRTKAWKPVMGIAEFVYSIAQKEKDFDEILNYIITVTTKWVWS